MSEKNFFQKVADKLKETWGSIWDGTNFIQENMTQIIRGTEAIKKATESGLAVGVKNAIPGGIDDAIINILNRAANKVLPTLKDAQLFNECIQKHDKDAAKIDCIADTLQKLNKHDQYDLLFRLAAEAIKEVIEEKTGEEISDDRARKLAQGAYDAKRIAEILKK